MRLWPRHLYHVHDSGFSGSDGRWEFPSWGGTFCGADLQRDESGSDTVIAFAAGAVAGTLTGLIHVKLKVRDLLSGIIMMTALYTVNLRIAGRANLPIYNMTTLFDNALVKKVFSGALAPFANTIIILIITLIMKFSLNLVYEYQVRLSASCGW